MLECHFVWQHTEQWNSAAGLGLCVRCSQIEKLSVRKRVRFDLCVKAERTSLKTAVQPALQQNLPLVIMMTRSQTARSSKMVSEIPKPRNVLEAFYFAVFIPFTNLLRYHGPGPKVFRVHWAVNLQKGGTAFFVLGLMYYFDNFDWAAYMYLALHGSYGFIWLLKDLVMPDMGFRTQVPITGLLSAWFLVLMPYWVLFRQLSLLIQSDCPVLAHFKSCNTCTSENMYCNIYICDRRCDDDVCRLSGMRVMWSLLRCVQCTDDAEIFHIKVQKRINQ